MIPWDAYSAIAAGSVTGRNVTTGSAVALDGSTVVGLCQALIVAFPLGLR